MNASSYFFVLFFLIPSYASSQTTITIDDFKDGMKPEWEAKIFKGRTYYQPATIDDTPCIQANSNGTASGMTYKIKINTKEYPVLNWQWQVDNIISKGDARTKAGDDYAARIYIAFPSLLFWQTKVINYIWANKIPLGTSIRSSYSKNFAMIAVESGEKNLGQWREYRVNIYQDYLENFGQEPPEVGVVAIMTDTDDTGESASACYGPIRFLSTE